MLAVSTVNDCRYCSWVHTELALQAGVNVQQIHGILSRSISVTAVSREDVAVEYAMFYADHGGATTREADAALALVWSPAECAEIKSILHGISFSNLGGNSADAWLARFRGYRVAEGYPFAEAIAAVVMAPFLLRIHLQSRRSKRAPMASLAAHSSTGTTLD